MAEKGIFRLIEKESELNGSNPAIESQNGEILSYSSLINIIDEFNAFAGSFELTKTTRIAVVSNRGFDMACLFFPVSKNCIFLPLNPDFTKEDFEKYFGLLKVDILMVGYNYKGYAVDVWKGPVIRYSIGKSINFDMVKSLESQKKSLTEYDDIAMILTTSGTTSTPKVVPLSYENLEISALQKISFFDFKRQDRDLILTPLHKGTSINSMIATIMSGGTVIIADGFNHKNFMKLLKDKSPTWFTASPAVLNSLAEYAKKKDLDFGSSLRFIRSSGAPLKKDTKEYLEREFKVPIVQTYGMTETRSIASNYGLSVYKEGSVGISVGNEIRIEDGEILVKGKNVFKGYEDNPEVNLRVFKDDWFRTGDLGYIDDEGYVFITGRLKEMINKGGEKVSPYEVEDNIFTHKNIIDCAVFPYPNDYGSQDVGTAIVLEKGCSIDLKELRNYLSDRMSSYKMPTLLYLVDKIPVSSSNKVQRRELFNILDSKYPEVRKNEYKKENSNRYRTLSDIEKELMLIWEEILNVKNISLEDNFFDLGGDSLAASVFYAELEDRFNIQISIDELFEMKTIREFSEFIGSRKKRKEDFKYLIRIKEGSEEIPVFFVHSVDGEVVTYHGVSKYMKSNRNLIGLKFKTDEDWIYPLNFDQLAVKYVEEMKRIYPKGPFRLCGNCYGGVLAYKIACYLEEIGEEVSLLAMIDPIMSKKPKDKVSFSMKKRIWYTFVDIREVGVIGIPGFIKKKFKSLTKLLKLKYQYRIYKDLSNRNERIPDYISKEIILREAKKNTKFDFYDNTAYYLLPSKTSKGSFSSIDYWKEKVKDLRIVNFDGSHHIENSEDLAQKIENLLESIDD